MNKTSSAVAAAILIGTAGTASAEIMIGTAGPMTGRYASVGAQMRAGAEQAVADINAAGGIGGEMLALSVEDDACDPEQAVAVARRMVDDDVVFVAGHSCSSASMAASSVYAEEGVIMTSPASTDPAFTDERPGEGVFRVCGRDDRQGEVAGNFLLERFPHARIAFVHDKSVYGRELADATLSVYEANGGTSVLRETYTAGEKDYTAMVTLLKSEDIDVLYVGGHHTEAGLMAREIRDQGMDTVLVSGDALATEAFWSITGEAGAGTFITHLPDPRKGEAAAPVVGRLREKGFEPEGVTLFTYAAVQVWAQAAAQASDAGDHDEMVGILNEGAFDTVLGDLSFDEFGDVTSPGFVMYEWKDGTYEHVR